MTDVAGTWVAIHPDMDKFGAELRTELEGIGDSKAIRVRADATQAKLELDGISTRLAAIGKESVGPTVRLGGSEETNAKLSALIAQLDDFGHKDETATVRVADRTPGGSGGFLTSIIGWLTVLGPLAVGAGADLAGSFASLPALGAGGGLAVAAVGASLDGLVKTVKDYQTANTDSNQSAATAHTQLVTLQADMDHLSPAGQQVVAMIEGQLLPAFHDLAAQDQQALFSAGSGGIADLVPLLRDATPYILQAARGIGGTASEMGKWATSTSGLHDINTILGEGNQLMSTLGGATEKVVIGFANLGAQRGSFGPLAQDVDNVASAFLRWTNDGGSERFLAYIHQVAPEVHRDVDDLAKAVETIVRDWAPLAPLWLGAADDLAKIATSLMEANPQLAQLAPEAMLAYKAFSLLKGLGIVSALSGIGSSASGAKSEVGGLASSLKSIAGKTFVASLVLDVTAAATSKLPGVDPNAKYSGVAGVLNSIGNAGIPVVSSFEKTFQNLGESARHGLGGDTPSAAQGGYSINTGTSNVLLKAGTTAAQAAAIQKLFNAGQPLAQAEATVYAGKSGQYGPPAPKTGAADPGGLPSPYAASVPGSATGTSPTAAQTLATTLANSAQSLLSTLAGLAAPAKNPVVAQQLALNSNAGKTNELISRIVAAHQAALMPLVPELRSALAAGMTQLVQLEKAAAVTRQTNRINAKTTSDATAAQGVATSTADQSTIDLLSALVKAGGATGVTDAQGNVDQIQKSTDVTILAAQDQVDAAQAQVTATSTGTALQQATAAKRLAIAQQGLSNANNSQLKQLAAANASLQAAQAEEDAAVQLQQTAGTIATDVGNAMSTLVSILSKIATDASKTSTDALTGATSLAADVSANAVTAIQDASRIQLDQLGLAGLSGYALQAAQAKVALDQLTQSYDAQIGSIKVRNDQAAVAQTALVDQATSSLDEITRSTQQKVNDAQAAYDATLSSNDQVARATAATALQQAKADQQVQVAKAQADLDSASATAADLQAQGAAALQGVQDQANQSEAVQQALVDKINALANGAGGLQVTTNITGIRDPLEAVDAMMFELHLAGAF